MALLPVLIGVPKKTLLKKPQTYILLTHVNLGTWGFMDERYKKFNS